MNILHNHNIACLGSYLRPCFFNTVTQQWIIPRFFSNYSVVSPLMHVEQHGEKTAMIGSAPATVHSSESQIFSHFCFRLHSLMGTALLTVCPWPLVARSGKLEPFLRNGCFRRTHSMLDKSLHQLLISKHSGLFEPCCQLCEPSEIKQPVFLS